MLTKKRVCWAFAAISMLGVLGTAGCTFVPGVPLDQPLAFSVRGGHPLIIWCGPDLDLQSIGVYYGTRAVKDDATLVFEGEGSRIVTSGGELYPLGGSDGWKIDTVKYEGEYFDEISMSLLGVVGGDAAEVISVLAEFDFQSPQQIRDWPEGRWKWANGEESSEPCGMPSAN